MVLSIVVPHFPSIGSGGMPPVPPPFYGGGDVKLLNKLQYLVFFYWDTYIFDFLRIKFINCFSTVDSSQIGA